ncbi:NADP-dependent oxidoreductase [Spiractinospora alimapuensis]|nr:NADP-dependent oxidoreductase [Spiractinospora alimapuensis]
MRLAEVPDGLPRAEHFRVVNAPLDPPGEGEVLVRNRYFHVFTALRTLLGASPENAHVGGLAPGDALWGATVGEVLSAPEASGLEPGDLVTHLAGWREYAVLPAAQCARVRDVLPDRAAHLGQGWPAYATLTRTAEVRSGDTVFVTGGAGAVGSMAGQFARLLGAGRVIGSTSSAEKATRLTKELGYDAVVVRGAGSIAEQLAAAAPAGIDVLFDTVGGEQLRAAVTAARSGARFALFGALSGQLAPDSAGRAAPVELDGLQVIMKQITMRGVMGISAQHAPEEWVDRFGGWLRSGEIAFTHQRISGLDRAPQAFSDMVAGRYLGAVIVEL